MMANCEILEVIAPSLNDFSTKGTCNVTSEYSSKLLFILAFVITIKGILFFFAFSAHNITSFVSPEYEIATATSPYSIKAEEVI